MKKFIYKDGASNYYLENNGMGGMLNPPNDLEHNYSIAEYRGGHYMGGSSLRYSLKDEYTPRQVKHFVKMFMKKNQLKLTEEWIHSCYNYFRACYSPDGEDRNVMHNLIDSANELPPKHHLAYLHIKQFFPEYEPRLDLIANNGPLGSWSKT